MQQTRSDIMSSSNPRQSKYISKDVEKARRAVERYQACQNPPIQAKYIKHDSLEPQRLKTRRSIKTSKSRDRRNPLQNKQPYMGCDVPYNAKPIKIHSESSCTSQQYAPSTISTKGVVLSRVRQNP